MHTRYDAARVLARACIRQQHRMRRKCPTQRCVRYETKVSTALPDLRVTVFSRVNLDALADEVTISMRACPPSSAQSSGAGKRMVRGVPWHTPARTH